MIFPREGLLSQFGQSFDDVIRPALPTVAEPAWFAPPVDVRQDEGALTIDFQISGPGASEVRVEASGRSLFVWGPRLERRAHPDAPPRAIRVFALPFETCPHDVRVSRVDDLVRVRIAKRVPRVSPGTTVDAP